MLTELSSYSCLANVDSQSGSLFLLLINHMFQSQCLLKNLDKYPHDHGSEIKDGDHFDFIVAGAGSAGSVVTNILVNDKKWSVLLLEAGGYPSITTEIPSLFFNIELTDQIWDYETEPSQTSCLGLRNGSCHWPRGKLLGGCSSINAMLYIRGNRENYDSWAKAGNIGWDYENVMRAYKENEKLEDNSLKSSDKYGKKGLLPITTYRPKDILRDHLFQSAKELGYSVYPTEVPNGFFESLQTIENGTRANSAKIFLGAVHNSRNLKLVTNASVDKIIIDKESLTAKGVEIKINGRKLKVFADKEIVLSAGPLNSPQILMNSGVGPKKHLEDNNIEVLKDLKVGHNLQDHLIYWLFSKIHDAVMKPTDQEDELYKYFSKRQGELSNTGPTNILGFLNSNNNSKYPDLQFDYILIKKNDTKQLDLVMEVINMNRDVWDNLKALNSKNPIMATIIALLQPKSRGRVLLRSNNPADDPIIRTGYLTDTYGNDIKTMLKGIRIAIAQTKTKAMRELGTEVLDIGIPNCANLKFNSDDYWKCALRNLGTTLYHPVGTCKMGPSSDPDAVVDAKLKVHGVKNLRVVDSGIMPTITSGNTNGPTMMIGRRAGEMILNEHHA